MAKFPRRDAVTLGFEFAGEGAQPIETDTLTDIDSQLLAIYRQRVTELG